MNRSEAILDAYRKEAAALTLTSDQRELIRVFHFVGEHTHRDGGRPPSMTIMRRRLPFDPRRALLCLEELGLIERSGQRRVLTAAGKLAWKRDLL